MRPLIAKLIGLLVGAALGWLQAKHGIKVSGEDRAQIEAWLSGVATVAGYVVTAYAAEWLAGIRRMMQKHGVVIPADTKTPAPVSSSPGAFDRQPPVP